MYTNLAKLPKVAYMGRPIAKRLPSTVDKRIKGHIPNTSMGRIHEAA